MLVSSSLNKTVLVTVQKCTCILCMHLTQENKWNVQTNTCNWIIQANVVVLAQNYRFYHFSCVQLWVHIASVLKNHLT